MFAVCRCERCGTRWTCRCTEDPSTNATELTGDQQTCPNLNCGHDDPFIEEVLYDDIEHQY